MNPNYIAIAILAAFLSIALIVPNLSIYIIAALFIAYFPILLKKEDYLPPVEATPKMRNEASEEYLQNFKYQYFKTATWQTKRFQVLSRAKFKCEICNSKEALEIHHSSYENLGEEPLRDLHALCRSCHQKQHDTYGYSYSTTYLPLIKET